MLREFARLHAHICGDGWITEVKKRRSLWDIRRYNRNKKCFIEWQIGYSNRQPNLLKRFREYLQSLTKAYVEVRHDEIRVRSKELFRKLQQLGENNSRKWIAGNQIFEAPESIKCEWLRAFFDDEATVERRGRVRIRVKSVNKRGLESVSMLLKDIGIISKISGPNSDDTWYLTISDDKSLHIFQSAIGFSHPEKAKKLSNFH